MNVLSLFDGISCGQLALKEAGHSFNYYASEIDRQAIECTQQNFPHHHATRRHPRVAQLVPPTHRSHHRRPPMPRPEFCRQTQRTKRPSICPVLHLRGVYRSLPTTLVPYGKCNDEKKRRKTYIRNTQMSANGDRLIKVHSTKQEKALLVQLVRTNPSYQEESAKTLHILRRSHVAT